MCMIKRAVVYVMCSYTNQYIYYKPGEDFILVIIKMMCFIGRLSPKILSCSSWDLFTK